MSSVIRPTGPLPPRVYWVRRVIAIVIVVVLLLILFWAVGAIRGGGGSPNAGASTSSVSQLPSSHPSTSTSHSSKSPSPSTSHKTSHSASPSKSATHSASPKVSTSTSSSTAVQPCATKSIAVTVSTDAKSYPSDVQPRLAMSVRNAGSVTCTRDVGQAALELRISTAAGVLVWSSDDCAPGGPHDSVTLQPNQVFRTAVVWGRTTSKVGCPTGQPKAASGSYVLTGRDLTITSGGASFTLL